MTDWKEVRFVYSVKRDKEQEKRDVREMLKKGLITQTKHPPVILSDALLGELSVGIGSDVQIRAKEKNWLQRILMGATSIFRRLSAKPRKVPKKIVTCSVAWLEKGLKENETLDRHKNRPYAILAEAAVKELGLGDKGEKAGLRKHPPVLMASGTAPGTGRLF